MRYLNGWHPFESIRFVLVKITMWRCLILQIWEQQKQLLLNQRVIQLHLQYNSFILLLPWWLLITAPMSLASWPRVSCIHSCDQFFNHCIVLAYKQAQVLSRDFHVPMPVVRIYKSLLHVCIDIVHASVAIQVLLTSCQASQCLDLPVYTCIQDYVYVYRLSICRHLLWQFSI